MEKLILKNGTEIEIEPDAGIGRMTTYVSDFAGLETLAGSLTRENMAEVKISSDQIIGATYQHMELLKPHFRVTSIESSLKVEFGLREMTEEELKAPILAQAVSLLTDEQAVAVKGLYDEYDPNGVSYKAGDRKIYNDILYKCLQDHTSQPGWEPGVAPSLWVALESGSEAGTLEDPIPVPDTVITSGMVYEYGKYYKEGDTVYLCQRGGVEDPESMYGQKETLYFAPSALIGQYFVVAN